MKAALVIFTVLVLAAVSAAAAPLKIVAAENFYGGVAAQIAGPDADVTSILSNPNQDPHEFTTNASTAKAVADADIVIYNGLGYDPWMDKLLGTSGKPGRVVICVANLIGAKDGDNPHIWYSPKTMPALADKLGEEMSKHEIQTRSIYPRIVADFKASLKPVQDEIDFVKKGYRAVTVTATEPVFGYMADALGFKMLNYDFQINIMNDTEPSAAQTVAFEKSLRPKTVRILFYNQQVTDPTTERLKKLAIQSGVPIVGVTETQPADCKTYADWMLREIKAVERALNNRSGFRNIDTNVDTILSP
jgi:zinc/manganese transport system substrate-binding protein